MASPQKHYGKWRIRWMDHSGQRRSAVYLSSKAAAIALRDFQVRNDKIRAGLLAPEITEKTFNDLCDKFYATRSALKRRPRLDETIIRIHLKPAFGALPLRSIGIDDIDQYKLNKAHLSPCSLHHHLTLLISMLRYAQELKWISVVLRIKKPKVALFDSDFRFLRTEDEIKRLIRSAYEEGDNIYSLYTTAIYTGMRAGELAGLMWSDIDFEQGLITVQRSYSDLTKSGSVRYIPLLDPLVPILKSWRLKCPGHIVFPSESGKMLVPSARAFKNIFHRTLNRSGFSRLERNGKEIPYICFHSLRHTFASHWMKRGGDIFKLQKILGHGSIQMTMRYAHLSPDAFAEDYDRLDDLTCTKFTAEVIKLTDCQQKSISMP